MGHEPRGFVAHAQDAHEFMVGNVVLRGREQVRGVDPLVERNVASLEYRSYSYAEGFLALPALVDAWARTLATQFVNAFGIGVATVRAERTSRPKQAFEVLPCRVRVGINIV